MAITQVTIGGAATSTTNPLPVASTIDATQDYLPIYTASATATQAINRNTFLGLSSQPLGLTDAQAPQNKTFDNTNVLTIKDGSLTLQNSAGTTKQARFSLASITAGQTRVFTLPDFNATLATLAGTETWTNKTLTSPTINGGTIDNAALTVDSISGHTSSTIVTVAGLSISNGVLNSNNSVKTSNYQNASVTPDKLATGSLTANVLTGETTTSTSYTDLATSGPAVTATIGANGLALVSVYSQAFNSGANDDLVSFAISGATTQAANDNLSFQWNGTTKLSASSVFLVTGLTPGSNTFTLKYRVAGGTGTFTNRRISVMPL